MVSMYNTLKVYYPHLQMFHLLARVQLRNTHPSHHGLEYLTRYVQECVRSSYLSPSFLPSHFPHSSLFPYLPPFLSPPTHTHTHLPPHSSQGPDRCGGSFSVAHQGGSPAALEGAMLSCLQTLHHHETVVHVHDLCFPNIDCSTVGVHVFAINDYI